MRIAIISSVLPPMTNGVATFVDNLARGLAADGHDVALVVSSFTGQTHHEKISDHLQIFWLSSQRFPYYPDQMHNLSGEKPPYKFGVWLSFHPKKEVFRALNEFRPDVIHLMTPEMLSIAAQKYAKKHKTPLVYTNHNYPETMTSWAHLHPPVKRLVEKWIWHFFRSFALAADFVTTPTERVMNDLLKTRGRHVEAPIAVISNGVDLSNFSKSAYAVHSASALKKQKQETRKKYQIPQNAKVVLYVGRVDPEKNVGKVLTAFELLHEKHPETFFVIVGDGLAISDLKKQVEHKKLTKNVRFLGRILMPELAKVYSSGDIFTSASEMETEGIVFIEAAAAGLPLVGVDKGGVSEICQNNRSGILCQPGNQQETIAEFSLAMEKLLFDYNFYKKMRSGALKIAAEHDFRETLRRFENIYRHLSAPPD